MIETTGEGKSAVATPDGKSRKKNKKGTDRQQGLFLRTLSRWLARNNIQCQPVGPESCQLQLSWTEDRQELFYDRMEVEKLLADNDCVSSGKMAVQTTGRGPEMNSTNVMLCNSG